MDHGGAHALVHELVHWASAVVLVIGGGVTLVAMALARRRAPLPPAPSPSSPTSRIAGADVPDRSLIVTLAGLSLGAAAIHVVAAPPHYVELGDLGAGFLVAAMLQAAWARAILRGASSRTVIAGFAINAAILAVWVVSRTIGLPIGPMAGLAEPVGFPDGAAAIFEGLLLAGLAILVVASRCQTTVRSPAARTLVAVTVVPVLGLVLLTTSLATLAIGAGAEHGMPGSAHGVPGSTATSPSWRP